MIINCLIHGLVERKSKGLNCPKCGFDSKKKIEHLC